jgi:hypothetical protein
VVFTDILDLAHCPSFINWDPVSSLGDRIKVRTLLSFLAEKSFILPPGMNQFVNPRPGFETSWNTEHYQKQ